eukprot:1269683-Amphidinium_carterae.1
MSALEAWRLAHHKVELGVAETTRFRCAREASNGLGMLVNLTALRDDGCYWDLRQPEHREKLEQLQARGEVGAGRKLKQCRGPKTDRGPPQTAWEWQPLPTQAAGSIEGGLCHATGGGCMAA